MYLSDFHFLLPLFVHSLTLVSIQPLASLPPDIGPLSSNVFFRQSTGLALLTYSITSFPAAWPSCSPPLEQHCHGRTPQRRHHPYLFTSAPYVFCCSRTLQICCAERSARVWVGGCLSGLSLAQGLCADSAIGTRIETEVAVTILVYSTNHKLDESRPLR